MLKSAAATLATKHLWCLWWVKHECSECWRTMHRNLSRYWSRPMSAIAEYMLSLSSYHVPMHWNLTSTPQQHLMLQN